MIDWQKIDTVFFDMDGTLLDLYFDNYFWSEHLPQRYAEQHQVPLADARALLENISIQDCGQLNWYCLDYWSKRLDLNIVVLKKEVAHLIQTRPGVEDLLDYLQQINKKLVLVTNAHQQSLQLKLDSTSIDKWFDNIICSHDYQKPKENLTFWSLLQNTISYDPNSTLLIDDSVPVLKSAREYGIRFLYSIARPDSQQARVETPEFQSIEHFDQLRPLY